MKEYTQQFLVNLLSLESRSWQLNSQEAAIPTFCSAIRITNAVQPFSFEISESAQKKSLTPRINVDRKNRRL